MIKNLTVPYYILLNKTLTSTNKILLAIIENDTYYLEFCTRTIKDLSTILGITPLGVTQALRKLHALGYLTMHESKSEKNRLQYKYTLNKIALDCDQL